MTRLSELIALALGIAVPLWLRQHAVEAQLRNRERALVDELRRVADSWNTWGEKLVREIKRDWRAGE